MGQNINQHESIDSSPERNMVKGANSYEVGETFNAGGNSGNSNLNSYDFSSHKTATQQNDYTSSHQEYNSSNVT